MVGAAGRTGRAVVEQAVEQGHQVTAFVHSDGSYDVPGIAVRTGDATDIATMEGAILGQDAVVDAVGGKTPYRRTTLEANVAAAIVGGMQRHGVRRLVVTSMFGEGDSATNAPFYVRILMATFLRGEVPDKSRKDRDDQPQRTGLGHRPPPLPDREARYRPCSHVSRWRP